MIKLIRETTSTAAALETAHQWPVKFTASFTADDTPAKIFVMQVAADDLTADSLSCVANAIQMTDLPEDAPVGDGPFYRVAEVTKLCRSSKAATEFIEKVIEATQDLVDNLVASESLVIAEEIIITPSS